MKNKSSFGFSQSVCKSQQHKNRIIENFLVIMVSNMVFPRVKNYFCDLSRAQLILLGPECQKHSEIFCETFLALFFINIETKKSRKSCLLVVLIKKSSWYLKDSVSQLKVEQLLKFFFFFS